MTLVELARKLRPIIVKAAESLDDKTASEATQLYDTLHNNGRLISAGTRINWHGVIKKAAVDLWDTADSTPDKAPALWEDIGYKDGVRIIPETITPGLSFSKGECGWWDDVLYQSSIDNNVWNPFVSPDLWTEVSDKEVIA